MIERLKTVGAFHLPFWALKQFFKNIKIFFQPILSMILFYLLGSVVTWQLEKMSFSQNKGILEQGLNDAYMVSAYSIDLMVFFAIIFLMVVCIVRAYKILTGQSLDFKTEIKFVSKGIFSCLGLLIIAFACVTLGMFLFIIPGLYLMVPLLFISPMLLLFDGHRVFSAFRYSFRMMKNKFWFLFKAAFTYLLICVVINFMFDLLTPRNPERGLLLTLEILLSLLSLFFLVGYLSFFKTSLFLRSKLLKNERINKNTLFEGNARFFQKFILLIALLFGVLYGFLHIAFGQEVMTGYYRGLGQYEKATLWSALALKRDPFLTALDLAALHYRGDLAPINPERAFYWAEIAAKNEDPRGKIMLAMLYLQEGPLNQSNKEKVIRLLHDAANKNSPFAKYILGVIYLEGQWVPENIQLGKEWLQKAAEQGSPEAKELLQEISKQKN